MTVPYFGDHSRFIEVSTHEMVHQFTIQKLIEAGRRGGDRARRSRSCRSGSSRGSPSTTRRAGSTSRRTSTCATSCGIRIRAGGYDVLPFGEDRIRGYIPTYKLGQARIAFIADQYGSEKIQAFLENAYLVGDAGRPAEAVGQRPRGFGALVRRVLNEPIEQVDARWRAWLKRRYYPAVPRREAGPLAASGSCASSRTRRRTSSPRRTATSCCSAASTGGAAARDSTSSTCATRGARSSSRRTACPASSRSTRSSTASSGSGTGSSRSPRRTGSATGSTSSASATR